MNKPTWAAGIRMVLVIGAIVLLSAWVGTSLNRTFVAGPQESFFSYSNAEGTPEFKPVKASDAQPTDTFEEARLAEVRDIVASRSMIPVDGRSEADYENGHLPGACSLSVAEFDKRFAEFSARYPKEGAYLIYCGSGQCGLSRQLASLLNAKGYRQLKVYSAGYNDWFLSGNPIEKGRGTLSK